MGYYAVRYWGNCLYFASIGLRRWNHIVTVSTVSGHHIEVLVWSHPGLILSSRYMIQMLSVCTMTVPLSLFENALSDTL